MSVELQRSPFMLSADWRRLGRSGSNLKPGTVCVCAMSGLRKGINTTQYLPSPASRAGTDLPTNVQAVSRAVRYVNTRRPRFQVRARPSYLGHAPLPPCGRGPARCLRLGLSKGFALTWYYRSLTWYFLCLSSLRTHFEPRNAVGTRRRGSLAAR